MFKLVIMLSDYLTKCKHNLIAEPNTKPNTKTDTNSGLFDWFFT